MTHNSPNEYRDPLGSLWNHAIAGPFRLAEKTLHRSRSFPRGRTACHMVPGHGDKVLHTGQGAPRMDTVQVETGGGGGGGCSPEPGGNVLRGQFRTGSIPVVLFSHSASRPAHSPAGLARRSLSGLGFRIPLGW